ncbi:MAG: potassium channel protein [Acidobacteria bacterium]|nr:MAG: potassium channel protein [Acidobacteriota bacterium]
MRIRHLLGLFVLLLVVLSAGTLGYHLIEHTSLLDSAYMTVITISTVGFREVVPLSRMGRMFTMVLILVGVGLIGYSFTRITSFFIEGELQQIIRGRKMEKVISRMKNHIIVCGYGRMGRDVTTILLENGKHVVVVDTDLSVATEDVAFLRGDATEDQVLLDAGIERAEAIVACLSTDSDNVFLTLSAKTLNPAIRIVSRAISGDSVGKLRRAGANEVVCMHEISARRMATVLVQPNLVNLVDIMAPARNLFLEVGEIKVDSNEDLLGASVSQVNLKRRTGALILAVRHLDGRVLFNPDSDYQMQNGDTLIIMGEREQIEKVSAIYK